MGKEKLTTRECFNKVLNYEVVDRCFYLGSIGVWSETIERWQNNGYKKAKINKILKRGDRLEWQGGLVFSRSSF